MESKRNYFNLIHIETRQGETQQVGDFRLTPITRVIGLHRPGLPGGLIWNRPIAVQVEAGNGEVHRLAVVDTTRRVQLSLIVIGIFGSLIIGRAIRLRRSLHD